MDFPSNSSDSELSYNITDVPPSVNRSQAERYLLSGVLFFSSTIGIVGNTAVIVAVLAVKKLQTTTNVFVVNLAVADLLTCVSAILQGVAFLSEELSLPLWLCQCMAFGILMCVGCSVNTLVCIAINRLVGVTSRMESAIRKLNGTCSVFLMVVLSWAIPIAMATIPLLTDYGELGYNSDYSTCTWRSNRAYQPRFSTAVAVIYFPVQFVILFVCYIKIFIYVRRTTRSTLRHDNPGDASSGNQTLQRQLWKRQVAVTKNLFLVLCVFLLCISPYFVLLGLPSKIVIAYLPYASTLLLANSSVNAIIYGTKHPDFRMAFARVLCTRGKKRQTSQTQPTPLTSNRSDPSTAASTTAVTISGQTQM